MGFNPSPSSALCSMHFKPTDFVRRVDIDLEGTKLDITRQRRLEIGVVPSVDFAGTGVGRFGRVVADSSNRDKIRSQAQVKTVNAACCITLCLIVEFLVGPCC